LTSTALNMFVLPALFLRFGVVPVLDAADDERP
jgi:hypothetical protein